MNNTNNDSRIIEFLTNMLHNNQHLEVIAGYVPLVIQDMNDYNIYIDDDSRIYYAGHSSELNIYLFRIFNAGSSFIVEIPSYNLKQLLSNTTVVADVRYCNE